MRIDEYLAAYESYRDVVVALGNEVNERAQGGEGIIEFVDYEDLEREYEKKKRILTRATKRLQRAIASIQDTKLSGYLTCKYLYRMTNERIAEKFTYCPRQVYRIARKAKAALYAVLLTEMPKPKRWAKNKRFRKSKFQHRGHTHRKYGPKAKARH